MYFDVTASLLRAIITIYDQLTETFRVRGRIYHRGTFYADVAATIRLALEIRLSPFIESEYNWSWWADQCEARAAALGNDAQFAMHLPEPAPDAGYIGYTKSLNDLRNMVAVVAGAIVQEMDDRDITDLGKITPAECAKITHRFAVYWLGKRGTNQIGYVVDWLWLAKVINELRWVYQQLGEPDRAGSAETPGGPMPPISWPGK